MKVGPFKISHPIGEGGMATVWGGVHASLGTAVAFKFMRPGKHTARGALRFLDETRALARMNHPGIVRIYDAGICTPEMADFLSDVEAESPYFVMESVSGGSLKGYAFDDWERVRKVLLHLLDALAHAHARDVIHRDIKPGNVLIDTSGQPRLTDFGISRLARSQRSTERMTGTPAYMAPEQIGGDSIREGPWTDLYAVGCLAYWLCSGAAPFVGELKDVLQQHLGSDPPKLQAKFGIPSGLEHWAKRLLAKDPQARYPRAADAARALEALGPAEQILKTVDSSDKDDHFPTLTVLFEDVEGLSGETSSGGSVDFSAPDPPRSWQASQSAPVFQLMSAGPGMLSLREPRFRGRREARDVLWEALRYVWETEEGRAIALEGAPGSGRTALWRWFGRRAHELGVAHTLVFDGDFRRALTEQLVQWWQTVGGVHGATAFYAQRGGLDDIAEWDLDQIRSLATGANPSAAILSAVHGRWTQKLGADRTVLLFGDAPELLGYLRATSATAPGRRLLVYEANQTDHFDDVIRLEAMTSAEIEGIVSEMTGLSPTSAQRLAERVEGNPGFAVKLAREAARADVLVEGKLGFDIEVDELDALVDAFDHEWDVAIASVKAMPQRKALGLLAHVGSRFTEDEFAAVCHRAEADPADLLVVLSEAGIMSVVGRSVQFDSPLARTAAQAIHHPQAADHEAIWEVFSTEPRTPQRRRIAATHGFIAGRVDVEGIVREARELRVLNESEVAARLLEDVRDGLPESDDRARHELCYALAECHIALQAYSAARAELRELPGNARDDDARALELFLAVRQFEDVHDEVVSFEPEQLSETPARMLAYIFMDFGLFDRARDLLLSVEPEHDPSGPFFALARLEFLQQNWKDAEHWGQRAADGFEEQDRPDGAIAALDIVASARLKQGRVADAVHLYRQNLENGRRIAAPTFVPAYNLATCLIETGQPGEEVDQLLRQVVADTMRRGRLDIEHVARAAQVFYALAIDDEELASHRLEKLEATELGPWVQGDSEMHLQNALEFADGEIATRIAAQLERIREVLAATSQS